MPSRSPTPRLTVIAAVLATVALSCAATPDMTAGQPPVPAGEQFFSGDDNPWTTPVSESAPIDPRSADYVARLPEADTPVVSVRRFTVPVYLSAEDASTPRFTMRPTSEFTPPGFQVDDVPIPGHAVPDPADDGHMVILDEASNCVYEFYRARRDGTGWTAEWVNATPAEGDGVYPDGRSSRASGFSVAAGLIWPEELRAGYIPHALVFAYPFTRKSGPVAPATRSDGRSSEGATLPIGARLVLDSAVDIDSLGLSPAERTIARALQEFGMILADTSGGMTLYAVHPSSYPNDPYADIWGDDVWAGIPNIPFDKMKVLQFEPPRQQRDLGPPVVNRCNGPEQAR